MESAKRENPVVVRILKIPSLWLGIFSLLCVFISLKNWTTSGASYRDLMAPPPGIERFTFGYEEVSADLLWIRTLQDFDYCEKSLSEGVCINNSWLYHMLDAVTNLAPHFRIPYAAGGLALTVLISDIEGATKIFDKGVVAFPHDWPLLYRAAYHYLYEVKDKKRAADLLIQAGQNGAPPWVFSLAGRLYSDNGYMDLAESLLANMIQAHQDPAIIHRLQQKIQSMKNMDK